MHEGETMRCQKQASNTSHNKPTRYHPAKTDEQLLKLPEEQAYQPDIDALTMRACAYNDDLANPVRGPANSVKGIHRDAIKPARAG
jgi:hypothetical protein